MIRRATLWDGPKIVALGERFNSTEFAPGGTFTFSRDKALKAVADYTGMPDRAMWVALREGEIVGMIGVEIIDHFFSEDRLMVEQFWYMAPEARGEGFKLLAAAEEWARSRGIKFVMAAAPTKRVGEAMRRRGYNFSEELYIKPL